MKWEKLKPPEPDDPMCCCECDAFQYGCCCNCEDLDEAVTRWLKDKPCKAEVQSPVLGAVIENLEVSLIPALVLLPLLLRVASLHYLLGVLVLTALPVLVLWYYYATHRKKRRTLFFLTLALYSLAYMYYLFVTEILPRGDVGQLQLFAVTAGMVLTIASLIRTKRGPGFVTRSTAEVHGPGTPTAGERQRPNAAEWTTCSVCRVTRPPRAGHCRTCGCCVQRLDHHCVCTALCFTCAWYSSIVTAGLFYLWVAQVVNISLNVTEREAQLALRNRTGRGRLWGVLTDTGEHSRGFCHNWVEFLTMTDGGTPAQSSDTDVV
ncbi:palmitoyltransferase ZDHHC23-like isoform X2 [Cynoglossus semilaevis]|uniref:palmitoyltransferase ZDHHC23-like isoform X2 n=1 Tax=Cynoglossus semilaevis TaxID=244447 RepID=UPI000D628FF4|nr:palmitoyltransferase ZDHHC23-like isoform X2 [Cynoglossus semilaevis]